MTSYQRSPRRERRPSAGAGVVLGVLIGSTFWIVFLLLLWWLG